ncbi:MAG TPA: FAD-linked oxidase C-terminal domain-containing protein, partial [Terriglobia bacterium]|nr:FAD-linked oxidase C-terminal domain-containing protein [Terriglobia bacterium]
YTRTLDEIGRSAGASVERLETETVDAAWSGIAGFRDTVAAASLDSPAYLAATVAPSAIEELVQQAQVRAAEEKLRLASYALPSVGVVHFSVLDGTPDAALHFIETLRSAATSLGGSLVVEWCTPEVKSRLDVWGPPGDDFDVMRKLKEAWDPKGVLSPGRFVGGL